MRQRYNQLLTYWPNLGEDGYGEESFGTPVAFQGRWEDKQIQVRTSTGVDIISRTEVWLPFEASIGGYLAIGDHTDTPEPNDVDGSEEIQDFIKIPSLRTNQWERRAIL